MYPFIVNKQYSRRDIYKIIGIDEDTKGGNWDTGYNKYNHDFFLFCNIGVPGRTRHIHKNKFIGDDLEWYAKDNTHLGQPLMKELINPKGYVYIFYREDQNLPFYFAGTGIPKFYDESSSPFYIVWEITNENNDTEHLKTDNDKITEGSKKTISVNVFERNPIARKYCIEHHGTECKVCGFDFEKTYGELGKDYIHVHHLIPLSEIREGYEVDPVKDLIPVCPNCHSMLHRRKPALSLIELKKLYLRRIN